MFRIKRGAAKGALIRAARSTRLSPLFLDMSAQVIAALLHPGDSGYFLNR